MNLAVGRTGLLRMNQFRGAWSVIALAVATLAQPVAAADLVEAWRAASQNDTPYAVGRADQATAQPRRDHVAHRAGALGATWGLRSHGKTP